VHQNKTSAMSKFPKKNEFFCAYIIRIKKRDNFVEKYFSIQAPFRRKNSILKFKNNGSSCFLVGKKQECIVLL
jgi:hypothetical protein